MVYLSIVSDRDSNFLVTFGELCEVQSELNCCFQLHIIPKPMDKFKWSTKLFLLFLELLL